MVSKAARVGNTTGLHLDPAGVFCQAAMKFKCSIRFKIGNDEANAKSVLSVLGACVRAGDEILLICEGEDEEEALNVMVDLVENGLGE